MCSFGMEWRRCDDATTIHREMMIEAPVWTWTLWTCDDWHRKMKMAHDTHNPPEHLLHLSRIIATHKIIKILSSLFARFNVWIYATHTHASYYVSRYAEDYNCLSHHPFGRLKEGRTYSQVEPAAKISKRINHSAQFHNIYFYFSELSLYRF